MTFKTKRAWKRARRRYVRSRMRHRNSGLPSVHISSTETRDEFIVRARAILEFAKWKRRQAPYRFSKYEQREELREVAILRTAATARQRIDPTNRAFYASLRTGAQHAFLYGPFGTQIAALRALPLARRSALDLDRSKTAFGSFGTCSIARGHAKPGILNPHLPPIPDLA